MSSLLKLSIERNSLLDAYEMIVRSEAQESTIKSGDELTEVYNKYFETVVPPSNIRPPVFERVSFANPAIWPVACAVAGD
ncbi:hypothetical protein [Ottowia sp.]|uniref:hypothetical protein n=1 Tax=Ottowia sp. TaxID=1898956 RepID=UPI002620A4C4|nr:hypothetical protein [Ottowia sp.]